MRRPSDKNLSKAAAEPTGKSSAAKKATFAVRIGLFLLIMLLSVLFYFGSFFYRQQPTKTHVAADIITSLESSSSVSKEWVLPKTWRMHEDHQLSSFRLNGRWSSLRPNIYFGLKQQNDAVGSPATGLLWTGVGRDGSRHVRHETALHEMQRLEWLRHNGHDFGVQRLRDNNVIGGDLICGFISWDVPQWSEKNSFVHLKWMQMLQIQSSQTDSKQSVFSSTASASGALVDVKPTSSYFYLSAECLEEGDIACLERFSFSDITVRQYRRDASHNHITTVIEGRNQHLGNFRLHFVEEVGDEDEESGVKVAVVANHFDVSSGAHQLYQEIKEPHRFRNQHRQSQQSSHFFDSNGNFRVTHPAVLVTDANGDDLKHVKKTNDQSLSFLAVQFTLNPARRVLISFEDHVEDSSVNERPGAEDLWQLWCTKSAEQWTQFDSKFTLLKQRSQSSSQGESHNIGLGEDEEIVKVALSSLLGGIGTFHGKATISNQIIDHVEDHKSTQLDIEPQLMTLTTATPSRTVFPRGFLWDEGFHQLVVSTWQPALTLQTLADWLQAMYLTVDGESDKDEEAEDEKEIDNRLEENTVGWIPREMILGVDGVKRVPAEFIPQRADIANPPTFFLVLKKLLRQVEEYEASKTCVDTTTCSSESSTSSAALSAHDNHLSRNDLRTFLLRIYPRLHAWLQWYLNTQRGDVPGSFRWRGRSSTDNKYLPNTLSSGLDDYPRAVAPSIHEKHVDLHAWMILACDTMREVADFVLFIDDDASSEQKTELSAEQRSMLRKRAAWYAEQSTFFKDTITEHHWVNEADGNGSDNTERISSEDSHSDPAPQDPPLVGFFDRGIYNDSAIIVTEALCRCVNAESRQAMDGYLPLQILQQIINYQQLVHQQSQSEGKKMATSLPPPPPAVCPPSHPQFLGPMGGGEGPHGYHTRERMHAAAFADNSTIPRIGYVNLFPLLLQTIELSGAQSILQLSALLDMMEDPTELWTDYGLRSIGAADLFYQRRNAPGDAPYWR